MVLLFSLARKRKVDVKPKTVKNDFCERKQALVISQLSLSTTLQFVLGRKTGGICCERTPFAERRCQSLPSHLQDQTIVF